MGATNIQDAKILIQSSRQADRTTGLKDLVHILRHNRGKPSLEALGNKTYLALCETLFQCLRDEQSSYLRGKSRSAKQAAILPLAALALRHVIASGVRTIKSSTVEIIVDVVIELLPGTDGLIKPLLEDLPKALRSLLEYQPHVERLSQDCWNAAVDFCVESLASFFTEPEVEPQNSWSTSVSSRARTPLEPPDATFSRASPRPPVTKANLISDEYIHATEDFVHCLLLLVKASNAPVLDKADDILSALLQYLQRRSGRGSVAAAALAAINAVLARTTLQSLELTRRTVRQLLPLMKSMWPELILRDEIIMALIITEPHISSTLALSDDETTHLDLEALIETMYGDYRRRQETTAHQYLEEDHLCFRHLGQAGKDIHPLHTYAFSMETGGQRFEALWATVSTIARFSFMLDQRKQKIAHDHSDIEQSSNKRLRTTQLFPEYLRHVFEPRSNAKRAALHVVAFMVQEGPVDEDNLQSMLEKLTSCISDENPVHSAWAMIGLAGAALQQAATHPSLSSYWISAWQTASRAITSLSLARAACHLMDVLLRLNIVPFAAVSETVQSMLLSIELSGPAVLTESSSSLLTTIIRERIKENPTHFNSTAERILNWLLSKWTPSLWSERMYSSLNAHHCNARDILRVLFACLDRSCGFPEPAPFLTLGPIAQTQMRAARYKDLADYLLLLEPTEECFVHTNAPREVPRDTTSEHHPIQTENKILDFCLSEVDKARSRGIDMIATNMQGITSDMMRVITNLCIVAPALATIGDDRRGSALEKAVTSLTEMLVSILTKPQTEQYKVDAVLETCTKNLPDISCLRHFGISVFKQAGLLILSQHLSKALSDRKEVKQSFYAEEAEFMDVDEDPDSQMASSQSGLEVDVARHDIQAETDASALRASCSAYLHLISSIADQNENEVHNLPSQFVDHLISLHENDLLRSRQFLRAVWNSELAISREDCLNLLERFSEALIDPRAREYNTSEVANGMLVEVLIGTALVWAPDATDREAQDLYDNVEALYAYYVKNMEKGGVRRSANLQKSIATFLQGLFKHHPDFGQNRKVPSVRTSLFELLSRGEMTVKYHIAERLPRMFEDFVLSEHDKILQDVDSSLPGDDEGLEGIAVRLLVLSKLASRWHTLLRQSIYRIFATAGIVPSAAQHAKRCISKVALARGVGDSQSLFRLFAPQIIYTSLDHDQKLAKIPYLTFGYRSLESLLKDIEAEAVGQAIMFGRKSEVEFLAGQLGTTVVEMLSKNIGKAAAYTLAWDTCRGFARNKAEPSFANLLKDMVGDTKYLELVQQQFHIVLGHMFQTIDHEERIGKSLDKKPPFNAAAKRIMEMTNISHSAQGLNIGIEPSFSAFYLPDQLERLCRRTGDQAADFWTPSIYTYVMRSLLDRMHPALGSLFARSIVRKIRIVVALAGRIAYEGYPLQMTLQSLRPFLTDIQCAEDTVGIMQYLFNHGAQYLKQHLSFVTGIGLSILISVRVFLSSSQESTTQQSQHVATMNAANRFHTWLTEYLKNHAQAIATTERSSAVKAFKLIITAASQVHAEGNSLRGSEESKLLLEILDDVKSGRRLLNKTSREVALDLLCQNFQPAPTARDDVLGMDIDAAEYAPLVWESCRRSNVGDGYLLWAARVLGRAFSASGEVKRSASQSLPWLSVVQTSKDSLGKSSREAIVREIIDLFYSDDRIEVSLAEDAIRQLVSRLSSADARYVAEMQRVIPDAICNALILNMPEDLESTPSMTEESLEQAASPNPIKDISHWIRDLTIALCRESTEDPILGALSKLLHGINHMAAKLLPYILHLVLLDEFEYERRVHDVMSKATMKWFRDSDASTTAYIRTLIQSILYLRSQPIPKEVTRVDRDRWLEIDPMKASQAANSCGLYRSALLFAETSASQPVTKSTTRRSSVLVDPPRIPLELQLSIYKNLDEPDSFYGVDRGSSLLSVLDRFEYEGNGVKSLLFRGARLDSQMRRNNEIEASDSRGTVKSLIMLNMNSVTHSLLSNDQFRDIGDDVVESTLHTARKLGQWDIKAPEVNHTESSTLFKAFQGLHFAKSVPEAQENFDRQLLATMYFLSRKSNSSVPSKVRLRTLAALTEADEIIRAERSEHVLDIWEGMKAREKWMRAGEFGDVRQLLSCRETLFNVLGSNSSLVDSLRTRMASIRNMEVEALVSSSSVCRKHGALQESLASVTYLSDIVAECKSVGLDIEATAQHEVASMLWEQGETEISIRMRQHLIDTADFDSQNVDLSLPVLLARLGHHLAEARLAKPDTIMEDYLQPAIRELKGQKQGAGPGQVFHEFALFCDKQLQSPEAAADMDRIKTVMDRKLQEYQEFTKLSKTDKSKGMRDTYYRSARRAKNWYDLDNAEYERLRKGREQFLRQCLENYLLSLFASDEYNNDALRVFSLWLEYSDTSLANAAVKTYLSEVPSGKFALLMNQLSSRLQAEDNDFQHLLMELVFRICVEHPYHGMHQIFAIQMKVGAFSREDVVRAKDESARSRQKAATELANALNGEKRAHAYWSSIYRSNEIYHHLAMFKGEKESTQQGRELPLDRYKESKDLVNKVPKLNVPPATLQIEVRPNMNYTDLPRIHAFKPTMSIANGLSAPKVITARGTDGKPYKQLFKSGNDDLRQDAIMEQVFDQVSRLLKNHTATRIRNLGIRTYKVLPLSTRSGLMEFVQNTIPLHLWVMPAHEKYYPSDYKPDRCRKEIGACQQDSQNKRVQVWNKIADNFHPVLRYFLLERFEDPDEWFERRLAYTRSTAAISILGHVLGLGDRHCHNILLDEKSGEVVHIDLGVSFEAGRVLPVPEVVPFRLTRDLVDAMGYTKTEGVFRRCCEFTMDTLREERESIMTLLNVLRYDPLVNWSVTPTKAKRMQEGNQETNGTTRSTTVPPGTPAPSGAPPTGSGNVGITADEVLHDSGRKKEQEEQAGEAGRALSVVEKKLSKTLSTMATVNELIQQSTDERNLAVLYMGWASYA